MNAFTQTDFIKLSVSTQTTFNFKSQWAMTEPVITPRNISSNKNSNDSNIIAPSLRKRAITLTKPQPMFKTSLESMNVKGRCRQAGGIDIFDI